jgi:membrane carboxypeptidase/penicillin-binding protein PbpC
VPDGLHEVTICALSGEPASPWCPNRVKEWLPAGDAPPCSWHHGSDEGLLTIYPPEFRTWASDLTPGTALLAASASRPAPRASRPAPRTSRLAPPASLLAIANPPEGAVYSIDPTLRREFQALPLRAVTARATTVRWSVDGAPVGSSSSDRPLSWPLAVGTHRIEVQDADGRRATTSVVVR